MGIYLVDYENVNCPGLNGIEELSKKDVVIVFYITSANRIDISVFKKIRAKISFILAESGTANALDFQLVTYLCRNAKKRKDYYIVSGDKGYSPVIHMLQEEGICVTEVPCIRAALANSNYETLIETNNIIPLEIAQKQTTEESGKTFYESKVEENDPVTEIAVIIMSKLGVYPADDMRELAALVL